MGATTLAEVGVAPLHPRIEKMPREELAGGPWRLRSPLVLAGIDDFVAGRSAPLDALRYVPV